MIDRRLMILGGTSGIGKEFFNFVQLEHGVRDFSQINSYGLEDFDVRNMHDLRSAIIETEPTDVLYSVGRNELDWIKEINPDTFRVLMDVNVWGFLSLIQQLQTTPIRRPVNVVAVTSDASWRPMRTSAIYCASKAALEMAVRVASRELAGYGFRINAVAPGKVEGTGMTEYVDKRVPVVRGWSVEAAEEYELRSTPLGRKVTKWEVAEVIWAVMNGPAAQTGEIIAVNGGR